ncbi:cytosolic carboxypeptidase 1 isoform X2 [Aplysia californica]|uniref:tubulin-glutamate carboxypeptidase n=1 Tax=Aplysia californica TaxID=6500 RepID=A0ABM0JEH3_APLCA|nr:cytosolic carboxypeptidase 1 isoform X2 [Aplysia californica]
MSAAPAEPSDKLVDRNRLHYWVQHIAKVLSRNSKKLTLEDMQQIRYASAKLFQLVQQIEKPSKDSFMKQYSSVDTLITVLQIVSCEQTINNIVNIFIDCVGKIQPAKRATVLVNHGLTTVLFQMLKLAHTTEITFLEDTLIAIHVLLSRIGHKDRKFAVKARLHQSLMLTLNLVKSNFHNFRSLQPLLQVLKLYTNNSVNASYLGKNNSINIMFKVISACGKRHTVDLRLALENLSNMTKSKSNSARLIGMGGVPQLLTLHSEWQQMDTKHRNLSIRRAILLILRNITNLKSGRKAFVDADGIRILYESALEASDCRDMESLILLASVILRKCYPRNKLPIDSTLCPARFILPDSPNHIPECYSLPNYPDSDNREGLLPSKFGRVYDVVRNLIGGAVPVCSWQDGPQAEESDHSSMDEDDDVDSDDEEFRTDTEEPDDDQLDGLEPAERRTTEDLRMYDTFFPELFLNESSQPNILTSPAQSSTSDFTTARSQTFMSPPDVLGMRQTVSDVSLFDMYRKANMDFTTTSRYYQQAPSSCGRPATHSQTFVKGSSVISLELGPRPSATAAKSAKSLPKGKPKKRSVTVPKEKKGRKLSTSRADEIVPDTSSALNCTSFQECDDSDQGTLSSNEDLDGEFCEFIHDAQLYGQMAADTFSVHRFQKLAFPDLYGAKGHSKRMENLVSRKFGVQRMKIFEDIDRMIHEQYLVDRVVYDLDRIIAEAGDSYCGSKSNLSNRDELRVGYIDQHSEALKFNAQFECGNLRKVIQVRQHEYDLILSPDINSNHHHQWFYFEVSNMQSNVPYRFNIVNCEKLNSQFNFGMQPLMLSVMDSIQGNPCWTRVGNDICYYKNHFIRNPNTTGGVKGKSYYTATFTVTFEHSGDICYLSYHYPYTYTQLKTHLCQWEKTLDSNLIYFQNQVLCKTLGGNDVPVLTITAQPKGVDRESLEEFRSRPYIFLSGRVHPGESNASWIMKGTIDFLLSRKPQAQQAREMFIFKIVPMLNPDGVLNGNHRSSLVGEDLNRRWAKPCSILHPTIYHTKGLLLYLNMINKTPMVYCDYHGHSRRKNIFMYGCSPAQSWIANDTQNPVCTNGKMNDTSFKALPRLLHSSCPSFCQQNCSFVVERVKESTARVVVWRHIGVVKSYTMESSYCGCDQGKYKDMHMNTSMLEEMGHKFCETLVRLARLKGAYDQQMPNLDPDSGLTGAMAEEYGDDLAAGTSRVFQGKDDPLNMESLLNASESDDDDDDEDEEEEFDDDLLDQ